MQRLLAPLLILALLLGVSGSAMAADPPVAPQPEPQKGAVVDATAPHASDRVLVGWRDSGKGPMVAQAHGLAKVTPLARGNAPARVSTNGRPVAAVLAELRADPNVEWAEPDYFFSVAEGETQAAVSVNDPRLAQQYSLYRMKVREAWSITKGGSAKIAVLDTGVQYSHPDLSGRLLAGKDFVNDDADASDDNGHGTWVAGIIAARVNDGKGIAGISWSDKILPVKIMNGNGTGSTSDLIEGIYWAADQGASIINMSIGGFPWHSGVQSAVNYAWGKGVVLVGAAGNNRLYQSHYPASYANVVSVSATQEDDEFANWSNYGPKVDVSAPGASVLTTNCDRGRTAGCRYWGEHIYISGTSFATPNTAAVVALMRARYPTWSAQQIVDRLIATSDDLGYRGWDPRYGHGRVNALRAVGGTVAAPTARARDGMESNDSLGTAHKIGLGVTHLPTIYPAGDVDHYAVDVPRAGRLDVRVTPVTDYSRAVKSSLPVDPIVELLTTSGSRLALVDNASDSWATEYAKVTVSGPTRIIVKVSNWFPNGTWAPYSVRADYVDTAAPKVIDRFPGVSASNLNRFVSPTVTFDEAVTNVNASTITLRNLDTGLLAPITVAYNSSQRRAVVTVGEQLAAQTTYRVGVSSGVRDLAGNAFSPISWTFTTGSFGFYDIGASSFQNDIAWLAMSGITAGCGEGRYCPTATVTREQMASFLARALELPASSTDHFADDDASAHEADINRVAAAGITAGCGEGAFCPRETVTREQMASFLARALNLAPTATDYFGDDAGSRHEPDINRLAASGITSGCGAGTFCPRDAVTREQMAAFLRRAFD